MVPIIYFVFIFFGYISIREVSSGKNSEKSCPDAKYPEWDIYNYGLLDCYKYSEDTCIYDDHGEKRWLSIFSFIAPEDVTDIYFNISLSGDKIDAGASGKGDSFHTRIGGKPVNSIPKNSKAFFYIDTYLKGDLPVGEEGVATVKLYFNEDKKDTPYLCVTGKIKIAD